jgi:hypothetical protein
LHRLLQLMFFSFQGSESSTSEGITKTFAAAKAAAAAAGASTIAVVLLDEVGLAEILPHNPLKVMYMHRANCAFGSCCCSLSLCDSSDYATYSVVTSHCEIHRGAWLRCN